MIWMWLTFSLLLLMAAWLLMIPLRRAALVEKRQRALEEGDDAAAQNVAVYRRREASLEAALERGDIDQERFDEDLKELQRALLDDTVHLRRSPLKSSTAGRVVVPLVIVLVVAASLGWYSHEGAEGDLALHQAIKSVREDPQRTPQQLMTTLEQQARQQPDNPNVWRTLYPLYRDGGQLDKAEQALDRLIVLEGRKAWWLAEKAQITYFANQRQLTPEVQALVDETLAMDPNEPTLMGLLGVDAFEEQQYQQAIDYWRRALAADIPPVIANAMQEGIRVATQRLDSANGTAAVSGNRVTVRLSLAEGLADRLPQDASIFVVARDSAGQLPPLAIQQLRPNQLPATVVLSEANAMSPAATLKDAAEVRLVARVSASGQAQAQPGDLMGERKGVAVSASDQDPVALIIDQVVE
ncbi:c-type cytochrome biogenesis protein CcmI [Halomonas cupida]|uniref:C-type cytochrome biogenesis protein CcmI n=1 Tax=Halomonas cupida TaxID=44933 RepID=A0A1M7F924_9GAMM|nr:c-type cytochrome biogenesis protein CcmI [Halomonas cupida]GEN23455.1 c-type cytochrome biogenesis protein CcmI [Halomonas cupida]SHM00490.1 cytochrome c-type biogenesis protein CcmH [Halomonas cupida]